MGLEFITAIEWVYIWCILGVISLISAVVGFIKGFAKSGTWAIEMLIALAIVVPCANAIYNGVYVVDGIEQNLSDWLSSTLIFVVFIVVLVIIALVFAWNKRIVKKGIESGLSRSYYKNYDQKTDNDEYIAHAARSNNEKRYRKYISKKYSSSSGAWGAYNKFLGVLNGVVTGLTITAITLAIILSICDIFNITLVFNNANTIGVYEFLSGFYDSAFYKAIVPYIFDALVVALVIFCVKHGYKKGALHSLWKIVSVVLVFAAGYCAQYLAFNQPLLIDASKSMESWLTSLSFSDTLTTFVDTLNNMGMAVTLLDVCQWIMTCILSVVLFIVVWIISKLINNLFENVDSDGMFGKFDGVIGVVFYTAIAFAVLLFVFGVLYTVNDMDFMSKFNYYMRYSSIASRFYQFNPITHLGWFDFIPLREWLKVMS